MTDKTGLEELKTKLKMKLKDFSSIIPNDLAYSNFEHSTVSRKELPVPELVLLMFRNILGYPYLGVGEKVRWSILCTFQNIPLALELRKFGFAIAHHPDDKIDPRIIIKQLNKAIAYIEQELQGFADEQISNGNITLENRYHEFDAKYQFFRQKADEAFLEITTISLDQSEENALSNFFNAKRKKEMEAYFYSSAMIDAFFNRLEHQLILLLAFSGKQLKQGQVIDFIRSNWDDKLKKVVDLQDFNTLYSNLKTLKERIRNPLSHGGFEKDRSSIYIHLDGIGTLPGSFSNVKNSIGLNFTPIDENEHETAIRLFDSFDKKVLSGNTKNPMKLISASIDPSFDSKSISDYHQAVQTDLNLEEYIADWNRNWELHTNMDY